MVRRPVTSNVIGQRIRSLTHLVEVSVTDTPHDSPSSITPRPTMQPHRRTTTRPVGVSILAVLHLIGGIVLFGAQFLLIANLQAMDESLRSIGIPPVLLIVGVMFLAVLAIASGVGMWMGTKWGWWLAAFYYVYSIFRNGSALLTIVVMADQLESGTRSPEYYMIKHGGRIIVHLLLFLYFFKGNVLEFFGMETLSKAKAIGILVGICIAILAVTSAISLLST